jgi:hypothetical protein
MTYDIASAKDEFCAEQREDRAKAQHRTNCRPPGVRAPAWQDMQLIGKTGETEASPVFYSAIAA